MSFKLTKLVLESEAIDKMDKLVLAVFFTYGDKDGTSIRPSIDGFAKRCSISRTTAYKYLDKFEAAKLISKTGEKHFYGRGHWSHVWAVNPDALSTYCTVSSPRTVSTGRKSSVHGADSQCPARVCNHIYDHTLASQPEETEGGREGDSVALAGTQTPSPDQDTQQEALLVEDTLFPNKRRASDPSPEAIEAIVLMRRHIGCYEIASLPRDPAKGEAFMIEGLWEFNHLHHVQTSGLYFRTVKQLVKALKNFGDDGAVARWVRHFEDDEEFQKCRHCNPKDGKYEYQRRQGRWDRGEA